MIESSPNNSNILILISKVQKLQVNAFHISVLCKKSNTVGIQFSDAQKPDRIIRLPVLYFFNTQMVKSQVIGQIIGRPVQHLNGIWILNQSLNDFGLFFAI